MKRVITLVITIAMISLMATSAFGALSINIYDPGSGSPIDGGSFSWTLTGTTIDIYETWTGAGRGFLIMSGLDISTVYIVNKHVTNSTGFDWHLFTHELLDPAGQDNDNSDQPIDPWVPAGFTHSNHSDFLSFADAYPAVARTSTAFPNLYADVLATRDFLEFSGGTVLGTGGTDLTMYGLTNFRYENEPFLLAQSPNEPAEPVIPEPGTLILLGSGLVGLGLFRRKK